MVSLRTGVGLYQGSILGCRETPFCEGVTGAVLSAVWSLAFGGRGCTYIGHCSLPGPEGPRLCQALLCIWGTVRSKHPRTLSSPTGSREVLIVQVSGLFSLLGWEWHPVAVDSGTAGWHARSGRGEQPQSIQSPAAEPRTKEGEAGAGRTSRLQAPGGPLGWSGRDWPPLLSHAQGCCGGEEQRSGGWS